MNLLIPLLLLELVTAVPLTRRSMYGWKEFKIISNQLNDVVNSRPYRIVPEPAPIPTTCITNTKKEGCKPSLLKAIEVYYDDAPTSWIFCHCSNAHFTAESMVQEFGRMPVALRQGVRHVMGFPLESAPRNLAGVAHWSRDIVLWDIGTEQVFLHEAAHLIDMWGLQDKEMKRYSDYPEFREAIIADKGCTATPYTESSYEMNNLAEIWAETFIFQRYAVEVLRISDGKVPEPWKSCISNQLKVISEQTDTFLRFKYRPDRCIPKDIPGDKCCTDASFDNGKWICEIVETIFDTEDRLIP